MLGRTSELRTLNACYDQEGSQIVVAYGQRNIGKTHILTQFTADKSFYYYKARSASEKEQIHQWRNELDQMGIEVQENLSYSGIFQSFTLSKRVKFVLIIDEFQHIIKGSDTFMQELIDFVHSNRNDAQVMVVLSCSSIGWVENSMANKIGSPAYELTDLLKIKSLSFEALVEHFPGFRVEECIQAYAILGGTPGLWQYFDDKLTIRDNICRNILSKSCYLHMEGERLVSDELRETGVYNTLLGAIAKGHRKLNDLYLHTGFSRAKISVYLKNLMELELVEKVLSYDVDGKGNGPKGLYRISNHFVDFHFTYLYPNMSMLERLDPETFFQNYIRPGFKLYVAKYFKEVCTQYLDQMNRRGRLPITYKRQGEWAGPEGTVDIIAQDEEGNSLVGQCNWDKPIMTYDDYEMLLKQAQEAGIVPDYVYLFSVGRFDEKLSLESKMKQNIKLVSVDDF